MKKDNRISPTLAMRLAAAYGLRDTALDTSDEPEPHARKKWTCSWANVGCCRGCRMATRATQRKHKSTGFQHSFQQFMTKGAIMTHTACFAFGLLLGGTLGVLAMAIVAGGGR